MRRFDKKKHIQKANLLLEQRLSEVSEPIGEISEDYLMSKIPFLTRFKPIHIFNGVGFLYEKSVKNVTANNSVFNQISVAMGSSNRVPDFKLNGVFKITLRLDGDDNGNYQILLSTNLKTNVDREGIDWDGLITNEKKKRFFDGLIKHWESGLSNKIDAEFGFEITVSNQEELQNAINRINKDLYLLSEKLDLIFGNFSLF